VSGTPRGRPMMRAMPAATLPTQCARARGTFIDRNVAPGDGASVTFDRIAAVASAGSASPAAHRRRITQAVLRPLR
jgi:hypothetical protein